MEESGFFEADIDERGLHPGQDSRHFALVDIADETAMSVAFEIELGKGAVFKQSHPHFERGGVDYDFTFHLEIVVRPLVAKIQTSARLRRLFAKLRYRNGLVQD